MRQKAAPTADPAFTGRTDRRSRRGTWSLIAVGFSILLLLLVTIAVGMQSFVVTRGFQAGTAAVTAREQMADLRRLQLAVSETARLRLVASTAGSTPSHQQFNESLERLTKSAEESSLAPAGITTLLQVAAATPDPNSATLGPVLDSLRQTLADQAVALEGQQAHAAELWSSWQRRAFHLVFLTNNLTMLLLITGGGLLLLYAGWHLDARQKLQEARQAVLKAERDRASFVAAAGHDLRQPLQAISLFVTTLVHRVDDPESKSLLAKITQSAASMRRMINGLLDVAKLDAGLVSADQMDQPLADLFAGLQEEFERQAESKGLVLVVEPTDAVVHTDPLLLESILRNLLANAINYTNHGHVSMSARLSGRRTVITVRDTGPGISSDEIDLIFRDFYRVGGAGGGGLGLGLGIVQRMAKLIYAQVAVESTLGLGTRFTVAVGSGASLSPPEPAPASALPERHEGRSGLKRVLLVDDNDPLRMALATHLSAWAVDVTQAGSLRAACDLARESSVPWDLAIVDYDLGMGRTGLELLRELDQIDGRRIPGLVITGSGDPDVHRTLTRSGYEWLQKPFEVEVLREMIMRLTTAPV